jgi:hypothetical protein
MPKKLRKENYSIHQKFPFIKRVRVQERESEEISKECNKVYDVNYMQFSESEMKWIIDNNRHFYERERE